MKALSIQEPWASAIAGGLKTIETRTWYTPYRGPLLLCASKKPVTPVAGNAVATCILVDCRRFVISDETAALTDYQEGIFSWVLEDVRPIYPLPVKGSLGIFDALIETADIEPGDIDAYRWIARNMML